MKERRQILEANVTVIPNKIMLSETNFLKVRYHIQPQFRVMEFFTPAMIQRKNLCKMSSRFPLGAGCRSHDKPMLVVDASTIRAVFWLAPTELILQLNKSMPTEGLNLLKSPHNFTSLHHDRSSRYCGWPSSHTGWGFNCWTAVIGSRCCGIPARNWRS